MALNNELSALNPARSRKGFVSTVPAPGFP